MEVGSARERIVIALPIYKFGKESIDTAIAITEPEVDVRMHGDPLSIETITGGKLGGVKIIWTVDAEQALPREVEISAEALEMQVKHPSSQMIPIQWVRKRVDYNPCDRWLGLWKRD